ncbi:Dicer-like protein 1 [Coemansia spiralis]|uniref:Dicer-like protein 1 n=2 Tax=Coemansia TaxID=4863 RepID=A0A9W8GF58_9FUNG|nr:Dicer-like protein 1 [Coemansia umbellata]KAJ2625781.1 Dicer-like protein 1 [Coemansia sp. RSA 1358]KAJ2680905.1 Dicer-like protein 1 [Coemansia spiralis]
MASVEESNTADFAFDNGGSDSGSNSDGSTSNTLLSLPSSIHPREYQLSLLKQALNDNTIVILETGTGKTLVAVMLIQWFAQREASLAKTSKTISNSQQQQSANTGSSKPQFRKKVRVFLNNTVALVRQQARVIVENTDQQVQEFIGSMGVDEWDDEKWANKWNSATVFVMTHQALLNALRAGYVHITDIDLLVFDECHHARGHHPYVLIMREFYDHCPANERPRIFGMTASPLNARQNAEESVTHLQFALDSNICTVDLIAHADTALTRQTSVCYEYKLPPQFEDTPLTLAFSEKCGTSNAIRAGLKAASIILPLLGPFGVDQMWHYYILQWYRKTMLRPARPIWPKVTTIAAVTTTTAVSNDDSGDNGGNKGIGSDSDNAGLEIDLDTNADAMDIEPEDHATGIETENQPSAVANIQDDPLLDALHLKKAIAIDHDFGSTSFNQQMLISAGAPTILGEGEKILPIPHLHSEAVGREHWKDVHSRLSPQVNRLLGILHQWHDRPSELRGIIFASRRLTAVLLVYIISRIEEFSFIKADVLLGVSQKSGSGIDRPIRGGSMRTANSLTLADFANGNINLIFATQVAEEGVDIQPCNLVVRFDMPKTATSLIQSRGRARMAGSQFIVMVPEVDASQKEMMDKDGMVIEEPGPKLYGSTNEVLSEHALELGEVSDSGNVEKTPNALIPEHKASYTDYLKLVSLEECLREWCHAEAISAGDQAVDGVITTSRSHIQYGKLLHRLREPLVLDTNPSTDLEELWIEQKDRSGRIYTVVSTQARITYMSAIPIIHCYVQMLPQDDFCKLVPVFVFSTIVRFEKPASPALAETPVADGATSSDQPLAPSETGSINNIVSVETPEGAAGTQVAKKKKKKKAPKPVAVMLYRCIITFPANAAIRQVAGPLMPNKKLAKQACAYRAAKKLHQVGAIDDNLSPVIEATEDELLNEVSNHSGTDSSKKSKGTRASIAIYEMAVPPQLIPSSLPPPPSVIQEVKVDTSSSCEPAAASETEVPPNSKEIPKASNDDTDIEPAYYPRPWYIYRFFLQHPSSPDPSQLALVTAHLLPTDTVVPIYTAQYTKGLEKVDDTVSLIRLNYIRSQILDKEQVDMLASFSSKLMARIINTAMVWTTAHIGAIVAPMVSDGTAIDFQLAHGCFEDRSGVYKHCNNKFEQLVNHVVMDGLDNGKLKIIEEICDGIDIHSDLAHYHASINGVATEMAPSTNATDSERMDQTENPPIVSTTPPMMPCDNLQTIDPRIDGSIPKLAKKKDKKDVSLRTSTRTMAAWATIKRVGRLVPKTDISKGVPIFKVKEVVLTYNYLVVSPAHLVSNGHQFRNQSSEDMNNTNTPSQISSYPDAIYSSPFFCASEPIGIDDLNNFSLLPAFLLRFEHVLLANTVKQRLNLPAKTETIRHAITASSASMDVCYERLETLGDSVLKYITSVMLFVTYPNDHEGLLTSRRSAIISNSNLFVLAQERELAQYIITNVFSKKEFQIPGKGWQRMLAIPNKWICTRAFSTNADEMDIGSSNNDAGGNRSIQELDHTDSLNTNTGLLQSDTNSAKKRRPQTRQISTMRQLSDKTIADIIESLLGASMLDGGLEGALSCAHTLGIVRSNWTSWSKFNRVWRSKLESRKTKIKQLEQLCGKAVNLSIETKVDENLLEEMELDQEDVLCGQSLLTNEVLLSELASQHYQKQSVHIGNGSWASNIESVLGYTFKDRRLLLEALTHCSSIDLLSNSYQRLEYLGDTVLDYFVTRRYYDYKPELSPHRITLVKHIATSNNLFAVILVCHGLHKFIRHDSVVLAELLRGYEQRLIHARKTWAASQKGNSESGSGRDAAELQDNMNICNEDDDNNANNASSFRVSSSMDTAPTWAGKSEAHPAKCRKVGANSTTDYSIAKSHEDDDIYKDIPPECWNLVEPPKVLGDIFESLIGAMYVDSGMDHEIANGFYKRLLSPFLDRFVDSGKLSLHPVIQSLLICQGWGCNILTWDGKTNPDQMEFINKYICNVKIHGHIVITGMGESPRHAKYNASSAFLNLIGAIAPNALYGDLHVANSLSVSDSENKASGVGSALDKLLKPICTCLEQRRAEAAVAAVGKAEAEAEKEAAKAVTVEAAIKPAVLEEGELELMHIELVA